MAGKNVQREYRLHVAIVDHKRTAFPQIQITHAGKGRDKQHAHFLKKMGYEAGTGDLIWDGVTAAGKDLHGEMEIKPKDGSQSPDQRTRQASCLRNGKLYMVVRSVREAHDYWKSLGFKPMHEAIVEPNLLTWEEKVGLVTNLYKPPTC